jgi:hypothetical protein
MKPEIKNKLAALPKIADEQQILSNEQLEII